jgi:hypothetical protein
MANEVGRVGEAHSLAWVLHAGVQSGGGGDGRWFLFSFELEETRVVCTPVSLNRTQGTTPT